MGLGGMMEIYPTGSMNLNHHQFVDNLKGKDLTKIPNPVDEVSDFIFSHLEYFELGGQLPASIGPVERYEL